MIVKEGFRQELSIDDKFEEQENIMWQKVLYLKVCSHNYFITTKGKIVTVQWKKWTIP